MWHYQSFHSQRPCGSLDLPVLRSNNPFDNGKKFPGVVASKQLKMLFPF